MKKIILVAIKDLYISKLKNVNSNDFWNYIEGHHSTYKEVFVSKKLLSEETYNIFLNDEGFSYLDVNHKHKFFDLFKDGIPSDECASEMLNKPYSSFEKRIGEEAIHLFALYEGDIEEYRKEDDIFQKMNKFVTKNKRDNKIVEGDSISARIFKEPDSPLTYLANIPKNRALCIDVSNDLITFFGNKNIQLK